MASSNCRQELPARRLLRREDGFGESHLEVTKCRRGVPLEHIDHLLRVGLLVQHDVCVEALNVDPEGVEQLGEPLAASSMT